MASEEELELDSIEGIGPVTKQKLNDAGIYNLMDLAARGVGEVADALSGDTAKASEMINRARNRLSELGVLAKDFVSAKELYQRRQNIERITTGSRSLDELLGGGVEVGAVTEFYGEFGSGKCVSADTRIPHILSSEGFANLMVDEIEDIYTSFTKSAGESRHGEGFTVKANELWVLGRDTIPKRADFLYRERASRIFRIKTAGGRRIDAAYWHRFLVCRDDGISWKSASELTSGDYIATPKFSYGSLCRTFFRNKSSMTSLNREFSFSKYLSVNSVSSAAWVKSRSSHFHLNTANRMKHEDDLKQRVYPLGRFLSRWQKLTGYSGLSLKHIASDYELLTREEVNQVVLSLVSMKQGRPNQSDLCTTELDTDSSHAKILLHSDSLLDNALNTLEEALRFDWDLVKDVEEMDYRGFIYDISVPDGHAYIGGNLPTLMHNSQVCHTLSVTVQLPKEKGGLDSGAVYIDTEGTFRPERIAEISESRGLDAGKVLDNIIVAKAYNSAHQELIVKELGKQFGKSKTKLVVVDSAVAHYRAEFLGRGTLAERQQKLNRFMHTILRIAEIYSVAVVVTNQVQASPDFFFGDPTRATGGHVVAHTSTYRIYLRKAAKSRIARMVDSPYHPEREAVFIINNKGIDDPNEETPKRRS